MTITSLHFHHTISERCGFCISVLFIQFWRFLKMFFLCFTLTDKQLRWYSLHAHVHIYSSYWNS